MTELVLLHVFLEPPPRPCTKMKSIRGSEGEWRRFNPRGPFESSTPSSVTVVALVKSLAPDANVLYPVGRVVVVEDKSVSMR